MTIPRLAALLNVSFNAAGRAVEQLVEAGILIAPAEQRYNRLFTAHEALSVINRPFGETPVLPER